MRGDLGYAAAAMALDRDLERWLKAGLIDAATRERIAAFEGARRRPTLLYALAGLGATTIGIGIVSIVAANWDAIGRPAKLGVDLALGLLLAGGLYWSVTRERRVATEVLAGIDFFFVLASLALIGQVYQINAPTYRALVTWSLATALLMSLVRTRLLGFLWLAGLFATVVATEAHHLERLRERAGLSGAALAEWIALAGFATPLLFLCAARTPWLVRERPAVSATWSGALWLLVVLAGFGLGFLFYEAVAPEQRLHWSIGATAGLVAGFAAALPRLHPTLPARAVLGLRLLLGASWLVFALAAGLARGELEAVGAIAQLGVLALAAWTVLSLGLVRVFHLVTGAIALRVLVAYFEVFGSMLSTGLGMITGGLLTLLLAWLWRRSSPELAAHVAGDGEEGVDGAA